MTEAPDEALTEVLIAEETGHKVRRKPSSQLETNDVARLASPKDRNFDKQNIGAKRAQKVASYNMLRDGTAISQRTQRNLAQLEIARKKRNGQKRSLREYVDCIFEVLADGEQHSVAEISRTIKGPWPSTHWTTHNKSGQYETEENLRDGGTETTVVKARNSSTTSIGQAAERIAIDLRTRE